MRRSGLAEAAGTGGRAEPATDSGSIDEARSTGLFRSLCETLEEHAVRTPDAVAVQSDDRSLTYRELDRSANRLARKLRRGGVGPDGLVAICMERSPEQMVALLGALKAGGAYLPLDPSYPAERIAFLFEDSAAAWLLTDASSSARLPRIRPATLILDPALSALQGEVEEPPEWRISPESLAYVIYTSGSTGSPKGVLIPHRALSGFALAAIETYGLSRRDRVLQFTSIGFDMSVEEIFPTWASGATLVLRGPEMLGSARNFLAECDRRDVQVLNLPTAYWHQLTQEILEEHLDLPPALRVLVIGGERVRPDLVAAWQERFAGGVRLFNGYGPTETTVVATAFEVPPVWSALEDVPIGRPLPGVEAFVLDELRRPVPGGTAGELYLGGRGVARGYLNRADLTAERFVESPLSPELGSRLYRTGDRVAVRPDGELAFLGRLDEQVKIRGYRVEPGEIEASLAGHPDVREALVTAEPASHGGSRLVAYVIPAAARDAGAGGFSEDLRAFLESRLPEYMIPAVFVPLRSWPLTRNGKVDRSALPAPGSERPDAHEPLTAPRTPEESLLLEIWLGVLGMDRIGIHDDFFLLGGHSLLALRVISRVRDRCGVELPLRALFDAPTIAGMAQALSGNGARPVPGLPPIRPRPRPAGGPARSAGGEPPAGDPGDSPAPKTPS